MTTPAYIGEQGELPASDFKIAVIVVNEFNAFFQLHYMPLMERLRALGFGEDKILVRAIPSLMDVVIATQFFAEYTDVDGVIVLIPESSMSEAVPIMDGIVRLQMQWNMVISVGGSERADHIVEMLTIQSEMASEAAVNASSSSIS